MSTRLSLVILFFCIVGVGGCDGDTPVEPQNATEVLYIPHIYQRTIPSVCRIYVYETAGMTLIDSITVDHLPLGMVASCDGNWLYMRVSNAYSPYIAKVNTYTGEVAWIRERPGLLRLLDNCQILISAETSGGVVVNRETGETVRKLPDSLRIGLGPMDGTEVAAIVTDSIGSVRPDSIVTVLNCATGATWGRFVPHFGRASFLRIYHAQLLPDRRRVAVIGLTGGGAWFEVGDVNTGEVLVSREINSPFGETDHSIDGSFLAVTDPGGIHSSYTTLDIYALSPPAHVKNFTFGFPVSEYMSMGQVRFSREHERLILAPGPPGAGADRVLSIDPASWAITDTIWPPGCRPDELVCPISGAIALGYREVRKPTELER
jgi:hypothetical protein